MSLTYELRRRCWYHHSIQSPFGNDERSGQGVFAGRVPDSKCNLGHHGEGDWVVHVSVFHCSHGICINNQNARKHKDDEPVEEGEHDRVNIESNLPSWDADFLKVDDSVLFGELYTASCLKLIYVQDIIVAAHNLDIPKLREYACIVSYHKVRSSTADEIRKMFGIKDSGERLLENYFPVRE